VKFDMPQPDEAIEVSIDAGDQTRGSGAMSRQWVAFLTKLRNDAVWRGRSGTTANRPTDGLEVGTQYFDTTLNMPIWVKTPTPAPAVWVRYDGAVV
jgi:hypothetical protein